MSDQEIRKIFRDKLISIYGDTYKEYIGSELESLTVNIVKEILAQQQSLPIDSVIAPFEQLCFCETDKSKLTADVHCPAHDKTIKPASSVVDSVSDQSGLCCPNPNCKSKNIKHKENYDYCGDCRGMFNGRTPKKLEAFKKANILVNDQLDK